MVGTLLLVRCEFLGLDLHRDAGLRQLGLDQLRGLLVHGVRSGLECEGETGRG